MAIFTSYHKFNHHKPESFNQVLSHHDLDSSPLIIDIREMSEEDQLISLSELENMIIQNNKLTFFRPYVISSIQYHTQNFTHIKNSRDLPSHFLSSTQKDSFNIAQNYDYNLYKTRIYSLKMLHENMSKQDYDKTLHLLRTEKKLLDYLDFLKL